MLEIILLFVLGLGSLYFVNLIISDKKYYNDIIKEYEKKTGKRYQYY